MVLEVFVRESGFFVLIGAAQVVGVELHDGFEMWHLVLVEAEGFGVESMLLNVLLDFVEDVEFFEMAKSFDSAT